MLGTRGTNINETEPWQTADASNGTMLTVISSLLYPPATCEVGVSLLKPTQLQVAGLGKYLSSDLCIIYLLTYETVASTLGT